MIRTKSSIHHKGSRVEIIDLFPAFNEYERVEIRFHDTGAATWINTDYLTEDDPGEIRKAIEKLENDKD